MAAEPNNPDTMKSRRSREIIKRIGLGPDVFPYQCTVGLRVPQSEISVWLDGIETPRDVTSINVIAGTRPLVIGIGSDTKESRPFATHQRPVLVLREQNAGHQTLGKISLNWVDTLSVGPAHLHLFRASHSSNYCLPKPRQWVRHLYHRYQQSRSGSRPTALDAKMPHRELECLFTFYICPRPVALVSAMDHGAGNIFPMDLIGDFADGYFSLALRNTSAAASLLESSGKFALSDIPMQHIKLACELGKNHNQTSVDLRHTGFSTRTSPSFALPVPQFSLRVREMQIETMRNVGSHKLFLARIIADQRFSDDLQPHFIHGFYQSWRQQAATPAV
jgi:flavin reductase (DIM6/NTAB) family NADH-FMN oxidoreductase RutF